MLSAVAAAPCAAHCSSLSTSVLGLPMAGGVPLNCAASFAASRSTVASSTWLVCFTSGWALQHNIYMTVHVAYMPRAQRCPAGIWQKVAKQQLLLTCRFTPARPTAETRVLIGCHQSLLIMLLCCPLFSPCGHWLLGCLKTDPQVPQPRLIQLVTLERSSSFLTYDCCYALTLLACAAWPPRSAAPGP